MKYPGRFIVVALVVVLGLAWAGRALHLGGQREPSTEDRNAAVPIEPGELKVRRADPGRGVPQPELESQDRLKQTEGGATRRDAQLMGQQQFHENRTPIATPTGGPPKTQFPDDADRQGLDVSVVGRPFPVSESILAACEQDSRSSRDCKPNRKLLDAMTEEPREEPWAIAAERAIRALVELEPGTETPRAVIHTIRAMECRQFTCFLETASIMGGFHTQLYYFEKTSGLSAGYPINSREIKEDGTVVHVTLWPFTRQ